MTKAQLHKALTEVQRLLTQRREARRSHLIALVSRLKNQHLITRSGRAMEDFRRGPARMSQQRVPYSMRVEARRNLGQWLDQHFDQILGRVHDVQYFDDPVGQMRRQLEEARERSRRYTADQMAMVRANAASRGLLLAEDGAFYNIERTREQWNQVAPFEVVAQNTTESRCPRCGLIGTYGYVPGYATGPDRYTWQHVDGRTCVVSRGELLGLDPALYKSTAPKKLAVEKPLKRVFSAQD